MEQERHQVSRLGATATATATESSQVTITSESTPSLWRPPQHESISISAFRSAIVATACAHYDLGTKSEAYHHLMNTLIRNPTGAPPKSTAISSQETKRAKKKPEPKRPHPPDHVAWAQSMLNQPSQYTFNAPYDYTRILKKQYEKRDVPQLGQQEKQSIPPSRCFPKKFPRE
jgi:hypothetical protein